MGNLLCWDEQPFSLHKKIHRKPNFLSFEFLHKFFLCSFQRCLEVFLSLFSYLKMLHFIHVQVQQNFLGFRVKLQNVNFLFASELFKVLLS